MATSTKKKSRSKNCSSDQNEEDLPSFLSEEKRLSASKTTAKQVNPFEKLVKQMPSERVDEELEKRQLSTKGTVDIRRLRLVTHESLQTKPNEQNFDFLVVIDFEATCEENQRQYKNEIIEFPLVLINVHEQRIVEQFQSYCRPVLNPTLSKFCTDLTGIQQHQVDNAPIFSDVLQNVERWLNERNLLTSTSPHRLAFATDGPWDFVDFLQKQCEFSGIPFPQWAERWVNIRKEFSQFYGFRRCGIRKMLEQLGLQFEGQPHSGLDDATNIARIAIQLLKDGCVLRLNDGVRTSEIASAKAPDQDDSIVFEN